MGDSVAGLATSGLLATVDFALIGHQESWKAAADVLAVLRGPEHTPLPDDEIKDILPWIPPRAVCHVGVGSISSSVGDAKSHGLYIDSFIPPDRLDAAYIHENIARVRSAAACAIKSGARIVSLGGFSSILIEGNFNQLPERQDTVFTTGNTLTVGFIVQGVKKMCAIEGRNIRRSTLLIVGATGDVGSSCARCLAPVVKRMLLSARNVERLRALAAELETNGDQVEIATDLQQFSVNASLVICAASLASPSLLLGRIAPDAIVCDAGYPKNLHKCADAWHQRLLRRIRADHWWTDLRAKILWNSESASIPRCGPWMSTRRHGSCSEGRFEPFSHGRGYITPERVKEIEKIAARHGIYLAPLYNADGAVADGLDRPMEWSSARSTW